MITSDSVFGYNYISVTSRIEYSGKRIRTHFEGPHASICRRQAVSYPHRVRVVDLNPSAIGDSGSKADRRRIRDAKGAFKRSTFSQFSTDRRRFGGG